MPVLSPPLLPEGRLKLMRHSCVQAKTARDATVRDRDSQRKELSKLGAEFKDKAEALDAQVGSFWGGEARKGGGVFMAGKRASGKRASGKRASGKHASGKRASGKRQWTCFPFPPPGTGHGA
jgi:hypothetical protein